MGKVDGERVGFNVGSAVGRKLIVGIKEIVGVIDG